MSNIKYDDQLYNLFFLMAQTSNVLFKARRKDLARDKINHSKAAILFIIQAIGNKATPSEIARCIAREPHSVSELLHKMEMEGLVRKEKNMKKKNQVRIVITEKGRQIYKISTKRVLIHRIMSVLSKGDSKRFKMYLKALRDKALEEIGAHYELPFP